MTTISRRRVLRQSRAVKRIGLLSAVALTAFAHTRYTLNGDLRIAYRASREGRRDIASA
jgi:hypothetical protein